MTNKHTTNGFMAWKDTIAQKDSGMVDILRKEGAVFYVKTTVPQTGMALETNSNLFGRTLNPFNSKLGAGGSSGGEAVLLALRGSPIGVGSDIGGSIVSSDRIV
jgi:amidase